MIVFAGSLHQQVAESLVGIWGEGSHQINFTLDGPANNLKLNMEFDGRIVSDCRIEFSKDGVLTIVSAQGEGFPIEGIINLHSGYQLQLWIDNREQRYIRTTA